eukprot:CAMPEP_0196725870 /NCGR_PEP_ID=MMETSP1091-20130531/7292_1 /TAXON_ID=302021 /ORGANISM="Rhodomonas sp., Strain CCMP768" /LENGTH=37 /DNA_ID= /DNA_START= /DNA_END= /DNA_ORIENTATION=
MSTISRELLASSRSIPRSSSFLCWRSSNRTFSTLCSL